MKGAVWALPWQCGISSNTQLSWHESCWPKSPNVGRKSLGLRIFLELGNQASVGRGVNHYRHQEGRPRMHQVFGLVFIVLCSLHLHDLFCFQMFPWIRPLKPGLTLVYWVGHSQLWLRYFCELWSLWGLSVQPNDTCLPAALAPVCFSLCPN